MNAETIAKHFKGKLTFIGGADIQNSLVNSLPNDICQEVYRLRKIFGECYIVSPGHGVILSDVLPENIGVMAKAAFGPL